MHPRKRLIICCDGTWNDADSSSGAPTNVTRISRLFSLACADDTVQIIHYASGVGTGSNTVDSLLGGAFGVGVAERVRDAYYFICSNYSPGDEIILVGFSRGAFTARSVAGLIGNIGLLTRDGMEDFYPIFEDMENWYRDEYKDAFPDRPFKDKPRGVNAAAEYRKRLKETDLTREAVAVKAIGVWDTVGSLGIPQTETMYKLRLQPSAKWYQFYDTSLSIEMEHAFQALALDELRPPFAPAVWERLADNNTTKLSQVWFPGSHSNVGGGKADQGMADIALAWMMDQLASVGVEFDQPAVDKQFRATEQWYRSDKNPANQPQGFFGNNDIPYCSESLYEQTKPVRPWGLGQITSSSNFIYKFAGSLNRTPGMYRQVDPKTNLPKNTYLQNTGEGVHSSVRVRLSIGGLALDDKRPYTALDGWELKSGKQSSSGSSRWQWEYQGSEQIPQRVLAEEPLGPFEKLLCDIRGAAGLYDREV